MPHSQKKTPAYTGWEKDRNQSSFALDQAPSGVQTLQNSWHEIHARPRFNLQMEKHTMNLILLIASAAEIAIATIILWYVVDLLTTMPANMRMVVKYLIVLVAILVVISMFVGQPIHVGFLPSPAPIIR